MVCVWPLSPSSYDVVLVTIVVINFIDGEIATVVAYFIDFVWANTCCTSCSVVTSFKAFSFI